MFTTKELQTKLRHFLSSNEKECVEFKLASTQYDVDKLGRYFSALSNEANIKNCPCAWLIFGVHDKTHEISGSSYKSLGNGLQNVKHDIAHNTTGNITFTEIYTVMEKGKRIVLFEIPPAPRGIPIAWHGHYFARDGESTVALNMQEYEKIRNQNNPDWSAQIIEGADFKDIDIEAVNEAKKQFLTKSPKYIDESKRWSTETFLNKAKLTIQGKITRTAIILLGKPESEHFLSPSLAKITWILKDATGNETAYEHFSTPFILNTDKVFAKIRNLTFRYMSNQSLFPNEIMKYDPWVIREALHNCIAHQDYELKGRISVVEYPDKLIFSNLGSFLPGNVETVIRQDAPPHIYRNKFLAEAMVNLNMIDTIGSGIRKMFITQKKRFFPLPNYNLKNSEVILEIDGNILNENYTSLLREKDLDMEIVMLLDKVQRRIKITKEEHQVLKKHNLVEGRYPCLTMSSIVAKYTGERAAYINNRGLDTDFYRELIRKFIEKHGVATRKDLDQLLIHKLPDFMSEEQKHRKINNIITGMSCMQKVIKNNGSRRSPKWILT